MDAVEDLIARYKGALDGRVGFVTGAGSGIGRATACALAQAGADVALFGRRRDVLVETSASVESRGRRALVLSGDAADPSEMSAAVERTVEQLGPPDVAVASAGANAWADLADLSPDMLRWALAVNVEGVANLARAIVPAMRQRGSGKLVVVASDNGRRPEPGGSGYVASKFGAVGLALSLSQELYGSGVAVHVVEPGSVATDWYADDPTAPVGKMLRAEDVALVILFLATLPASIVLEEVMPLPRRLLAEP